MESASDRPLQGKIAVVTGATRGCGRGIAVELGAAGATVYCTGRSSRTVKCDVTPLPNGTTGRPETIEKTAELVEAAGGRGIPVRVDHTKPEQVEALFERIKEEQQGRLDILVNDIWGGDELTEWDTPFWKQSLEKGLALLERAIHTHIITNRYGVPLMVAQGNGIVFEITDGDDLHYRDTLFYDLAKVTVIRLALAMDKDFKARNIPITSVAVTPGWLRSEVMLDLFGVTEETWRDAVPERPAFAYSETPRYLGRAIVALCKDPDIEAKAGDREKALSTWTLSRVYNFRDVDGRQPHWGDQCEGLPE